MVTELVTFVPGSKNRRLLGRFDARVHPRQVGAGYGLEQRGDAHHAERLNGLDVAADDAHGPREGLVGGRLSGVVRVEVAQVGARHLGVGEGVARVSHLIVIVLTCTQPFAPVEHVFAEEHVVAA